MTNVVCDSEGDIFSTKTGDAAAGARSSNETPGSRARSARRSVNLPVEDNHILIYTDLGVYTGQRLGTPCDDL